MNRFKLLNVFTIIIILLAVFPPGKVQAYIEISEDVTISNDATWVTDIVVTNGATLTIAPNVNVTVNCSDFNPYTSGKDPNKIELIIKDGTLIADQVVFQGAEANSCWYGIEILDNGDATITRSTISDVRVGITVEESSAEISGNTITSVWGLPDEADPNRRTATGIYVVDGDDGIIIENNNITGVQGGDAPDDILPLSGGLAYGILVIRTNDITMQGNKIEYIQGGDAGAWTTKASDGADGVDGDCSDNQNPTAGADGANGNAGGSGANAYGIFAQSSVDVKTMAVVKNTITNITGGNGSRGQWGGDGGDSGDANCQVGAVGDNPTDGIAGAAGGNGGNGGAGGVGGDAYGIWSSKMTASINENQITRLLGGLASVGVLGGSGGAGGNGGKGSDSVIHTTPKIPAGFGGSGGAGGAGGTTGNSGEGGSAIGVYFGLASLNSFLQNTIRDVTGRPGGLGNMGASGGVGGIGGDGGMGYDPYRFGGGGGAGGLAGKGGQAGNGGNGGSAYGLWFINATVSKIDSNVIEKISAGSGFYGGMGGIGQTGGVGGNVRQYPNVDDVNVTGGVGGMGGAAGRGGNGGRAGFAYAIYATGANGNTIVVNNLIYDVYAPTGGKGGDGGAGGDGGRGGSGVTVVSDDVDAPGGDGGNGGAAGNGGDGADNVPGVSMVNASAFYLSSYSTSTSSWLLTNNTIVNISSANSDPGKGLKGVPGDGGAGGNGSPAGSAGDAGAIGHDGNPGVKGQTGGYYSGPYVTSDLYNNIIAWLPTEPLSNSVGLFKALDGTVSGFRYGDVYGWQKNYGDSLVTIDKTGSISTDPLFVDFETKDYHLQVTSSCVDTGLDTAPGVPTIDIEGTTRPYGGHIDMGAYEFDPLGGLDFSIFLPMITK